MENKRFWYIVNEINWGELVRQYREIKGIDRPQPYTIGSNICETLFEDVTEAQEFLELCKDFEKNIENAVNDNGVKISGISDDSWWDVKAHIVGLGEEAYNFSVKHPEAIKLMFIENDQFSLKYYENFEYCANNYIRNHSKSEPVFKKEKVETYYVHAFCPKCGAEMKADNIAYFACPAQYPHTCPNCGYKRMFDKCYPAIEYEGVDEKNEEENLLKNAEKKRS